MNLDAKNTRESSKNALKMVYYIIIGLAIAEALSRTFMRNGLFIGWQVFDSNNIQTTLLLLAFLPTICRFVHGASLHLDVLPRKRYKTLFDFMALGFSHHSFI